MFKDIQVMDLEVVVFAARVSVYFSCRSVYVSMLLSVSICAFVCMDARVCVIIQPFSTQFSVYLTSDKPFYLVGPVILVAKFHRRG